MGDTNFVAGLWVIFCIPAAIVCGEIGRKKTGRERLWSVLGFLGGPFALAIALLMPFDPLWVDERRKRRDAATEGA